MADTLTTILDLENGTFSGSLDPYRLEIHKEGEPRSKQHSVEAVKEIIIDALGDLTGDPGAPGVNGLTPGFVVPLDDSPPNVSGPEGQPLLGIKASGQVFIGHAVADTINSSEWTDTTINLKGPPGEDGEDASADPTIVHIYETPPGVGGFATGMIVRADDALYMALSDVVGDGVDIATEIPGVSPQWVKIGGETTIESITVGDPGSFPIVDFDTTDLLALLVDMCNRILAIEALHTGSFNGAMDPDNAYTITKGHLQP